MRRRYTCYRQNHEEAEPAVNLTPLIDVVFVILIAFIVIAPLLERDNIELATTTGISDQKKIREASAISLKVYSDNTMALNGQRIEESTLLGQLRRIRDASPEVIPQLFHDKNARFGTYQKIKNTVEEAGFSALEVVLEPQ